jgi:hypothetical protein
MPKAKKHTTTPTTAEPASPRLVSWAADAKADAYPPGERIGDAIDKVQAVIDIIATSNISCSDQIEGTTIAFLADVLADAVEQIQAADLAAIRRDTSGQDAA